MAYEPEDEIDDEMPSAPAAGTVRSVRPQPVLDVEEEPEFGTTGGVIPKQAGTWNRKPMTTADLSPDLRTRRQQVREEVDRRRKEEFEKAHPFTPTGWQPPTPRIAYRQGIQQGEEAYGDYVRQQRAQAVQQRRDAAAQLKEQRAQAIDDSRATGKRYQTNPRTGALEPMVDPETGRQLYAETDWQPAEHPKDKRPVRMKTDKFGQRQFKDYPLVASPDPLEGRFYYDIGDGESVAAMTFEEAAASKDVGLAQRGKAAMKRKMFAERNEAISAMQAVSDTVAMEYNTAVERSAALKSRIEALQMGGGDPKEVDALTAQQMENDALIDPSRGPLALRKKISERALATERIKARRDAYLVQRDELATRLAAQGIDPMQDPTFRENEKALAAFEQGYQAATAAEQEIERLMQPVQPVAGAVAPQEVSTLAETGKSLARGATSEGLYAATQGVAELFSQSPIRRGLESLEDWATEKIQGFPLTEQQKATRARLRQQAAEKTGTATVDRFAKDYAKATGQLREEIRRALPVDEKFAQSKLGQIAQGVGQLAGTAPMAAFGPAGIAAASVGQIYDEAYQDAKQSGQDDATAHSTAMKYLPAAGLDFLSDRLVIGKLLKPLVGKMTVGAFLKDVLKTGAMEGATEAGQQLYLNQIAKNLEGYDPNRPFDKEVLDSALVGFVVGSGANVAGRGIQRIAGGPDDGGNVQAPEQPPVGPTEQQATPQVTPQVAPQVAATPSQNFPTADLTETEQAQAELEAALAEETPLATGAPEQPEQAAGIAPEPVSVGAEAIPEATEAPTPEAPVSVGEVAPINTPEAQPEQGAAIPLQEPAPVPAGDTQAVTPEPVATPATTVEAQPAQAKNETQSRASGLVFDATEGSSGKRQDIVDVDIEVSLLEDKLKKGRKLSISDFERLMDGSIAQANLIGSEIDASPERFVAALREAVNKKKAQAQQQPTAKPIPEGTQFLYEQNGTRYYQMPDAEAVRGSRTVDEATLQKEGFDTANLPTEAAKDRFDKELQAQNERIRREMASRPIGEQDPDFWVRNEVERMALEKGLSLAESREMHRPTLRKMIKRVIERQVYKKLPIHKNAVGETNAHKGYLEKPPRGYKLEGDYYVYSPAQPTTEEPTNAIPEQGAATLPVQPAPENRQEVRGGNQVVQEPAGTGQAEGQAAVRTEVGFDAKKGLGAVPYNQEVAYRGFERKMKPSQFIEIAAKKQGEETSPQLEKMIRAGKPVGPPFFNVRWDSDAKAWRAVGHEGRNRSEAISRISPEIEMPVHFFPEGMRARDLTEEMRNAPILPEAPKRTLEGIRKQRAKMKQPASPAVAPAPVETAPEAKPEPTARDYDAEETASGTKYQYKLIKEGDMWTAQMRMVRPDGTTTEWDGPIGVGRHRDRAKVAERFAEEFPDAAKVSEDAEISEGYVRIQERKTKEETKQKEAARAEQEQRDTMNAFLRDVEATQLPKGQNKEIEVFRRDADGNEGMKKVMAVVYGDWAIQKNDNPRATQDKYIVTHVPSGLKARGTENLSKAKQIIKGFILSGVDSSSPNMKSDNEALKRLSHTLRGLYENTAPSWYKPKAGKVDVKPEPEPAPQAPEAPEPTPVAQMSRADLRAELKAAGVESVSGGVPVDQAAPNQLMAAVGKLRQGKLEETKPTSDKIIEALQNSKFQKPGRTYAHTPLSLAWDSAIDLAILAVRAGRAINEVVQMGVNRFKARYPQHTPEDVAKLEAEIRKTASEPLPPRPTKQEKSRLPESYKAVGVPAETLEYDVRNQAERKREAADIIKRDGREKAEAAIEDKALPRDTRVAIGGELVNERMLALKDAKPEDVDRISRDIRRIVAKMRPELATESGQAIAMFNSIYEDASVAAATEYVRNVQAERVRKMGGEDAEKAAKEAAAVFNNKKLTDAEKQAAIEELKKKFTTKPVTRMLNELKRVETVKKLNELGVLTDDDMLTVAGNALGIPGISQNKLKHLAELADRIKNAKNHAEKSRAELELADALSVYKGIKPADLETSILTLNILSGYTTQLRNLAGNTMQAFSNLATTAATNPKQVKALVDGLMDGIGIGKTQAKSIWETGRGTRDFQDKTQMAGSALANVDYARDYGLDPKVGDILTKRARLIERISRFMRAADAVFYYPAREAYARMATTKLLEGKYQGEELARRVKEILNVTPEAFAAAERQAKSEGYDGINLGRRTYDIIEEKRKLTDFGKTATEQAEQFGAESTFTNEPVGFAGIVYRNLNRLVQESRLGGVQVLKPWMMFLRTPSNVFNASLNYTPLGAVRAKFGVASEKQGEWKNFNREERNRLYLQSMIGTSLMGGILMRTLMAKGDDDDFEVSAGGPSDPNKRRQLINAGWKPYSIKVGKTYLSYRDSPLLIPLAIVGNVADAVKYKKSKDDLLLESRVADAVAQAPQIIFQTSMLSGLADLMSGLSGGKNLASSVGRNLSGIPANLIIPYNRLLQQIDQTFDPKQRERDLTTGNIPFVRRMGEVRTDVQGRPETYIPIEAFGSRESNDPVDKLLIDKDVFIPDVAKNVKLGNREMTEDERTLYRRMSGQRIRARIQASVPYLKNKSPEAVEKDIDKIVREERERVRERIRLSSLTQRKAP